MSFSRHRSQVEQHIELEMICPYEPGKPIWEVKEELGLEAVIKLASNENPAGPSPRALDMLNRSNLELHTYPDYHGWYLREALAEALSLPVGAFVIGAGSSELMRLIADVYLGPGTEALVTDICFPVYANVTRVRGAAAVVVPLDESLDYDLEQMLAAVNQCTRVVFLASPNNPTGRAIPPADIATFLERLPTRVLCVLDLAYYEYTDPELRVDAETLLRKHPNLVMLRTFSKVYGLAGLRVGYAIAASDVVEALDRVRIPFATSTAAQVAARAALADQQHAERSVTLNAAMRQRLYDDMAALDLKTLSSQANFALVDVRADSNSVFQGLLHRGVIVRPVGAPRLNTCLRVTTGTEPQMAAFAEGLAAVL